MLSCMDSSVKQNESMSLQFECLLHGAKQLVEEKVLRLLCSGDFFAARPGCVIDHLVFTPGA